MTVFVPQLAESSDKQSCGLPASKRETLPIIEPGTGGWEARTLPLCYAVPLTLLPHFCWMQKNQICCQSGWSALAFKTRIHFFTCPVKPEVCPPDFCKHVCYLNTEVSKIMLRYIDLLSKETKTTISKLHQTKPLPVADCSSAGPSTRLWSLLTSVKRCLKFNVLLNEPRERKV